MYIIRLSLLGAILGNLLVGAAAQTDLPSVTHSGYLSTNKSDNSELFYAYYEAEKDAAPGTSAPVLLWLQVRPDNLASMITTRVSSVMECCTGRPRLCQHVR